MLITKLYKKDESGRIRIWRIEVDEHRGRYRMHSGVEGGKIVTSDWTQCEIKNEGRSNETNPGEQAKLEYFAHIQKRLKRGYVRNPNDIDELKLIKPMLAHRFEDHQHKLQWPVWCQPKLDGIRCIANADGLWTRKGEPILTVPHIADIVVEICQAKNITLDGELYNHDLKDDFGEIMSLVRRQKQSPEHAAKVRDVVQYHIYDLVNRGICFSDRWESLNRFFKGETDIVKFVSTYKCRNQGELDKQMLLYLKQGYEGQMIRMDENYQTKRTHFLLKRKEFQDEEFRILEIEEGRGNRSEMTGSVILFDTKSKIIFNAALMGGVDFNKKVWKNKNKLIGATATVKFFHRTPDGIPRFPVVKHIHGFE